ncbi:Maf family nucleotide pyrophosphatase [Filomicrobium sp.]|uniref:Maf family nucleotide pyrophosphatase n=1 Tax=Filomicrobium sp. TaxID=2024831 RepID=UPI00258F9ADA|nr:Maf family nucleotide pyrophosphatase [Filomicrobium sp.]MCV0368487.1 Maf family nucleotide pyrophosphatase [Filomicrobium sp.]
MLETSQLILASGSRARYSLLKSAGVAFTVIPADIDETAVRETLTSDNPEIDPVDVADVLARVKGEAVSAANPDSLVIAADQVLALGPEIFSKPADLEDARECLKKLRGRTHQLHSAVVLAENGEVTWAHVETADMTMRNFSTTFLSEYLVKAGEAVCHSVGGYQLEGQGIQLFEKIDGDYFTILGLPLLPLLAELRQRDVLTS